MPWYTLTDEELARLNPPDDAAARWDWLPVGMVPRPSSRLGWFVYHVVHGLLMRYPLHKVLGYALANTRPAEYNLSDCDAAGGVLEYTIVGSDGLAYSAGSAVYGSGVTGTAVDWGDQSITHVSDDFDRRLLRFYGMDENLLEHEQELRAKLSALPPWIDRLAEELTITAFGNQEKGD